VVWSNLFFHAWQHYFYRPKFLQLFTLKILVIYIFVIILTYILFICKKYGLVTSTIDTVTYELGKLLQCIYNEANVYFTLLRKMVLNSTKLGFFGL